MKNNKIIIRKPMVWRVLIMACFLLPGNTSGMGETEDITAANLYLDYYKNNDNSRTLVATLSTREQGRIVYLQGEIVDLYLNEISKEGFIGFVITDENGQGKLNSGKHLFTADMAGKTQFEFIALLHEQENYSADTVRLSVRESILKMECIEKDSVKYVEAAFGMVDSIGQIIPVESVEIHFYIRRMLGMLPIGGDYTYTNEDGEISIEFPADITGNDEGEVEIFVKVENEDPFGTLTKSKLIRWGVPLENQSRFERGSLWGNRGNAPLFLIIISNLIILGVWGIILYLIFQIYRIRKLGKEN